MSPPSLQCISSIVLSLEIPEYYAEVKSKNKWCAKKMRTFLNCTAYIGTFYHLAPKQYVAQESFLYIQNLELKTVPTVCKTFVYYQHQPRKLNF